MSAEILFVSGIDTGIGKTVATGLYARERMQRGERVVTQKMVQTGCRGLSEDILLHRRLQGLDLLPEDQDGTTCPYVFDYPCSPHLAAARQGQRIDPAVIDRATAILAERYDCVLIEGAGGLAVPYDGDHTLLDFVAERDYPLILVTSGRLGSLNHTLLSLMACRQYGIRVARVIYNTHPPADPVIDADSQHYLQNHLAAHWPETEFTLLAAQEM
ncbi:dethiobiotin synthetase [Neisseria sp. HSC-16F19]|nr:dethiobiotin synthase [Neisseria sp. HSC-16F19]MCP2040865.1 dethiobiotin synthetase [Neisseria sp. HSC-16F19]